MQSCQDPAFRQNLVFHKFVALDGDLGKDSAGTFNPVRHLTEIVRPIGELAPDIFLQAIVSTKTESVLSRINSQEIAQDHGDSVRIPEVLISFLCRVNGKAVQEFAKEDHVLMVGGQLPAPRPKVKIHCENHLIAHPVRITHHLPFESVLVIQRIKVCITKKSPPVKTAAMSVRWQ